MISPAPIIAPPENPPPGEMEPFKITYTPKRKIKGTAREQPNFNNGSFIG